MDYTTPEGRERLRARCDTLARMCVEHDDRRYGFREQLALGGE